MNFLHTHIFIGLLHAYGYAGLALVVGLECLGLPLPGEGLLIMAAVYAGSTHDLNPYLVGVSAAVGSIVGQMRGYALVSAWAIACCAATVRVSACPRGAWR